MRKYIIGSVVILALVGFIIMATKNNDKISTSSDGSYCSSEGKLTNKRPTQSHRSYCLKSNYMQTGFNVNTPSTYTFSIVDDTGKILKSFDTIHEKQMHLIVVRKDLNNFQHVHPVYDPNTGLFSISNLVFPNDGEYRLYADFTPSTSQIGAEGEKLPVVAYEDVKAGDVNKYKPQPIGELDEVKNFSGYDIQMNNDPQPIAAGSMNMTSFEIKKNGQPVLNLQNYLGALGHSVVLSEGRLDFIHAHPITESTSTQTGKVDFHITFPTEGRYKVFTQFQHENNIITSDFVVSVAQSGETADEEHMGH